jgi:hypothetical protein
MKFTAGARVSTEFAINKGQVSQLSRLFLNSEHEPLHFSLWVSL